MPFVTVLILVGLTEGSRLTSGKGFAMEPVLGGFLLGGFLFVLDGVNPNFQSKLSTLIILTAFVLYGPNLTKLFVTKKTAKGKKSKSAPLKYV